MIISYNRINHHMYVKAECNFKCCECDSVFYNLSSSLDFEHFLICAVYKVEKRPKSVLRACVLWQEGDPACPLLPMATPSLTVAAIHTIDTIQYTCRQKAHTCCLKIFINMQHAFCTNQDVCHWQTLTKYDKKLYNELFTGRDKSEHVESTSHEWRRPFKDNWKDWSDCPHVCAQWQEEWGGRYFVLTLLPH